MKIDINKDFEAHFQNTAWQGLTFRETLIGVAALAASSGIVMLVWHLTDLPVNVCVYFGIPVMIPIVVIGIMRYQGSGVWELMKELSYLKHTEEIPFEAEEYQEALHPVFTMESAIKRDSRRRRK